jgi:hypothetical protein
MRLLKSGFYNATHQSALVYYSCSADKSIVAVCATAPATVIGMLLYGHLIRDYFGNKIQKCIDLSNMTESQDFVGRTFALLLAMLFRKSLHCSNSRKYRQ